MNGLPLISVVVPSFNQARFIGETLQSLVDQQYPNLEVIVQDGGSTDGAVEIAREFVERHPATFSLFVEKDTGHAQAVNRGMRRTHGEILGYLNTDDTLYPGCLHSAAREIDPSRGRHVVFGRCVFTGEGSVYVGTEHPAEFQSHFNHLAIWRRGFNTIPQPATFWHRRVYERCGDFDEKHNHGLDYLQWCRFSRYFRFHKVDEMWATYRMHAASVSANKSEQDWLDIMTQYSRMSWGPWWHPVRWRCAISYWVHGHEFHEQARHHARRAEESWGGRRYLQAVWQAMLTTRYSPTMTWHRLLQPLLAEKSYAALALVLLRSNGNGAAEFTGKYSDNWIGPVFRQELKLPAARSKLNLVLEHVPQPGGQHSKIKTTLLVDGRRVATERRDAAGQFNVQAVVERTVGKETTSIELRTQPYFVPRLAFGAPDDRKLSALLLETTLQTQL